MADLFFSINNNNSYFAVTPTTYNPLSGGAGLEETRIYFLLNLTYGNPITITVIPNGPSVILYYVLIGPQGQAAYYKDYSGGGGSTGGIGQGSININSTTVLTLTNWEAGVTLYETSLSFDGDFPFFSAGGGNPGTGTWAESNPGGNGTNYFVNTEPVGVYSVVCGSAGGAGGFNGVYTSNDTYGPNGTSYGAYAYSNSTNGLPGVVQFTMADGTMCLSGAGTAGSGTSNGPTSYATAGGLPPQALFYYSIPP